MLFSSLPLTIIHAVVLAAEAQDPLGPCRSRSALRRVCTSLRAALDAQHLLAALCRLKFDTRAIERRVFAPNTPDLAGQFRLNMRLIHALQIALAHPDRAYLQINQGRDDDTEDLLRTGWVLLLENDGKNYAQLDHAGYYQFVRRFVRFRLWEEREANAGWPRDTPVNALALMSLWMMTTQARLDAESSTERSELKTQIVPFVLCTPRYPSAEAPPNHFDLPLLPSHRPQQEPISLLSADSPYAPIYPHYPEIHAPRVVNAPLWGARFPIAPPLCTTAARLLWMARQPPLGIPPHLPPAPGPGVTGATQQHYIEFNRTPAAKLIAGPTWDWDQNRPIPIQTTSTQPPGIDDSLRWDTEFWRKTLCVDYTAPKPRFAPGEVYRRGSLHGTWRGRCYIPFGQHFTLMLNNPVYPSVPDPTHPELFTDFSLAPVPIPICFEVEEHHRICGCPMTTRVDEHGNEICEDGQGCGIVPVPPIVQHSEPKHLQRFVREREGLPSPAEGESPTDIQVPFPEYMEYGMMNSFFPGTLGGLKFVKKEQTAAPLKGIAVRDQVVLTFDSQQTDANAQGDCNNLQKSSSKLTPGSFRPEQDPITTFPVPPPRGSGPFVYETYDPAKMSIHEVAKHRRALDDPECQNCRALEDKKREERDRSAEESRLERQRRVAEAQAALDRMMRSAPSSMKSRESSSAAADLLEDISLDGGGDLGMLVDALEANVARAARGASVARSPPPSVKGKGKRPFDEMETELSTGTVAAASSSRLSLATHDSDSPSPPKLARSSSSSSLAGPSIPSSSSNASSSSSSSPPSSPTSSSQDSHSSPLQKQTRRPQTSKEIDTGLSLPVRGPHVPFSADRSSAAGDVLRMTYPGANADEMDANVDDDVDDMDTETDHTASDAELFMEPRGASPTPSIASSDELEAENNRPEQYVYQSFYDRRLPVQPTIFGDDFPAQEKVYVCVKDPSHYVAPSSSSSSISGGLTPTAGEDLEGRGECEGGCQFELQTPERHVYDRHRVGVDCTGVRDVVFTGQTESKFGMADWKSTLYGRVRPWDGLIGMLRTAWTMNGQPQFFFVFGYIVGGETFVGEWRFAAIAPWRPTWGGPFVMSKVSNDVTPVRKFEACPNREEGMAGVV